MSHVEEFWETIEGYPNYAISSYGTVLNVKSGREVKSISNAKGHTTVRLSKKGHRTTFRVCRLVAKAFFLNYSEGVKVKHKNGLKTDNTVLNLTLEPRKG